MPTVRNHFDSIFLGMLSPIRLSIILHNKTCDTPDGEILEEMPLDSECGQSCKRVLDHALLLATDVDRCFAGQRPVHVFNILSAAVDTCCCYIRG